MVRGFFFVKYGVVIGCGERDVFCSAAVISLFSWVYLGWLMGFEPTATGATIHSNDILHSL